MLEKTRQIAVIGGGYWGKNLVRNFAELGALRAICDTSPELQASYAKQYPGVEIVASTSAAVRHPDIEGVVIATPASTHYALVKEALDAGKDVFVEKPLALRREEGAELVALAQARSRILMVGHILQYHPAVTKLKELIQGGVLGKIQYIYSNRLNIGKIRTEENILWSFAPHDISVMLGLLGEPPVRVCAQGGSYLHEKTPDVTMTTFAFASGVRGHVYVSWLHPFKEQRLVVVGEKKMAVFDDAATAGKLVTYAHEVQWIERKPVAHKANAEVVEIGTDEPLRLECQHFLDCVANRQNPRTDGAEGLAVLSVLDACQKSLDQDGAAITLAAPQAKAAYFVHESSYVDLPSEIGAGTSIWHFSHVLKGTRIGRNCNIGQNVVIGPDVIVGNGVKIQSNVSVYKGVTLEDEVFCGPSMVFTNVNNPRSGIRRMDELRSTLVKKGASIGANATIVCGHTIGSFSFVGAGAVVTKDVPDFALVVGAPARVVGWMCQCGVQLEVAGPETVCSACGIKYQTNNGSVRRLA